MSLVGGGTDWFSNLDCNSRVVSTIGDIVGFLQHSLILRLLDNLLLINLGNCLAGASREPPTLLCAGSDTCHSVTGG